MKVALIFYKGELPMEQVFDFRQEADLAEEVSAEIDYLNTQQLVKVHNYIQNLQKETEKNK